MQRRPHANATAVWTFRWRNNASGRQASRKVSAFFERAAFSGNDVEASALIDRRTWLVRQAHDRIASFIPAGGFLKPGTPQMARIPDTLRRAEKRAEMGTSVRPGSGRHVLIKRLSSHWILDDEEEEALLHALNPPMLFHRGQDVVADGTRILSIHVLTAGVACRHRMLADGKRQIVAFLLPGDIIELFCPVTDIVDHDVSALSNCEIASMPLHSFRVLAGAHPNLGFALWRYGFSQYSILLGWLANMRRRSADERLAYLFCEQVTRLTCVGLAERGRPFRLNIAQGDLADAAAISSVHANRTLQELRKRNLIGRDPAMLEILDWDALRELADFDPAYLHLHEPAINATGPEEYPGWRAGHAATGSFNHVIFERHLRQRLK